jgi:hypothetical protein
MRRKSALHGSASVPGPVRGIQAKNVTTIRHLQVCQGTPPFRPSLVYEYIFCRPIETWSSARTLKTIEAAKKTWHSSAFDGKAARVESIWRLYVVVTHHVADFLSWGKQRNGYLRTVLKFL